jgi:hypothetical protein
MKIMNVINENVIINILNKILLFFFMSLIKHAFLVKNKPNRNNSN